MGKSRRDFSAEFKTEIVRLVRSGEKTVAEVCEIHELYSSTVYQWLRQDKIEAGKGPKGALSTAEKEELSVLRREIRSLRRERDFLKSAAAYFAQEKKRGSM